MPSLNFQDIKAAYSLTESWMKVKQFEALLTQLSPADQQSAYADVQLVIPSTGTGGAQPPSIPPLHLMGTQILEITTALRGFLTERLHAVGVLTPEEVPAPVPAEEPPA